MTAGDDAGREAGRSALWADAVRTLSTWAAPDEPQESLRRAYLAHLEAHPDGLWRGGPPEHLTASTHILDATGARVLLTLHRKGGFWVQCGGHLEPDDLTLAGAARREASEESGIAGLRPFADVPFSRPGAHGPAAPPGAAGRPAPVDLHRHDLPATFGRCREHLDVAYGFVAPPGAEPAASDESVEVAWWPVDALPEGTVPDLAARLPRVLAAFRTSRTSGP